MNAEPHPFVVTVLRIVRQFQRSGVSVLAAGVAYHALFAFVPLLIFLTAMVGIVSNAIGIESVMGTVTDWLYNRSGLPKEAADVLRGPLESVLSSKSGTALGLGGLLALYGAQNGIRSLMRALNVAYDVEEGRNWFAKTATSVALTIAIGVGLLAVAILVLAGGRIGAALADLLHLSGEFRAFWGVSRWIAAPVVLAIGLAVLYWAGPNRKARIDWISPGAILAVLLFGAATWGLGLYFDYAARYVTAYGMLGAVMAFVFWLYVMALVALLGATVNAVLDEEQGIAPQPRVAPKPDAAWIGLPLPPPLPPSSPAPGPATAADDAPPGGEPGSRPAAGEAPGRRGITELPGRLARRPGGRAG
ncbi:MAG: YihY/virulence factor BrkB family protein [Chloroflexota bacterium]